MYAIEQAKTDIVKMINPLLPGSAEITAQDIVFPASPHFGDLSLPCFELAKKLEKNPQETAAFLRPKIRSLGLVDSFEIMGPYLNFRLNKKKVTRLVLKQISLQKKQYGNNKIGKNKKILIEYVSPNSNKPLHLGHIRNGLIGESLARLLKSSGYKVIRACLVNDRGVHISKSMLAYQKWGKNDSPGKSFLKSDHFVGKYYVMYEREAKKQPALKEKLHTLLKRWEAGDKKTIALWKKMNKWALLGFEETFERLGFKFDKFDFESKVYKKGKQIVEQGLKRGVFKFNAKGDAVSNFRTRFLPEKVVLRADGTTVYITADLALAEKRLTQKLDKIIYIVGSEQDLYFKQLFEILLRLGYDTGKLCHLNYGMIYLPAGKMKSREGTVVDADDFLNKLEERAAREVSARHDFLTKTEIEKRAAQIAQAALKYFILKVNPKTEMSFDPGKSLSFIGNTGPYLLYTHARICSILKKAGALRKHKINWEKLTKLEEWELILQLAKFPEIIEKSALTYDPEELSKYLYELAVKFSNFYHELHVLKAPLEIRLPRLLLINGVREVLDKGLMILGVKPLKAM